MVQKRESAARRGQNRIVGMIAFRDASRFGSIFISGRFDCGWMNLRQHEVVEYLLEENRVLREQIGTPRFKG